MDILFILGIVCFIIRFTLPTPERTISNLYIGNKTQEIPKTRITKKVSYVDESGNTIPGERYIPFRIVGENERLESNDIVLVEVFNHNDCKNRCE